MKKAAKLISATATTDCPGGCGAQVRTALYEGADAARLNEVRDGRDQPGGHTAQDCQQRRGR